MGIGDVKQTIRRRNNNRFYTELQGVQNRRKREALQGFSVKFNRRCRIQSNRNVFPPHVKEALDFLGGSLFKRLCPDLDPVKS